MPEMIDRIAAAIHAAAGPGSRSWEDAGEQEIARFRDMAVAALHALRNPTDEMLYQGQVAICGTDRREPQDRAEIAWNSMLDASAA